MLKLYTTFGSSISEMSFSSDTLGGYRYGFNGEEKENDISGEGIAYDLGARFYDGRLGRMFSLDPLAANYPWQSPFAYCNNSPISMIDINGMGGPFNAEAAGDYDNTSNSSQGPAYINPALTSDDNFKYSSASITLVNSTYFSYSSIDVKRSILEFTSATVTTKRFGKTKTKANDQYQPNVVNILTNASSNMKNVTFSDNSGATNVSVNHYNAFADKTGENSYFIYCKSFSEKEETYGTFSLFEELCHLENMISGLTQLSQDIDGNWVYPNAAANREEEMRAKVQVIQRFGATISTGEYKYYLGGTNSLASCGSNNSNNYILMSATELQYIEEHFLNYQSDAVVKRAFNAYLMTTIYFKDPYKVLIDGKNETGQTQVNATGQTCPVAIPGSGAYPNR